MSALLFANNAQTTLAGGITNVATSANLSPGAGVEFPSPGAGQYFCMTLVDAATGLLNEVVHVTAISGDTITMVRAQEGTTAKAWLAGDLAANLWTSGSAQAMAQATDIQNASYNYAVDTGTANSYAATFSPAPTVLTDGMLLRVKAAHTNTGASTFSPNGLAAQAIVGGNLAALTGGEIVASADLTLQWNTSVGSPGSWVLQSSVGLTQAAGDVRYAQKSGSTSQAFSTAALTVNGAAGISGDVSSSSDQTIYSYNGGTAGNVRAGIQLIGSTQEVRTYIGGSTKTSVTSTGLAAIGNITVTGDISAAGQLISNSGGTTGASFRAINSGGTTYFAIDNSTGAGFGTAGNYGTVIYRPASTGFAISRVGTVDIAISSSGAVTIPATLGVTGKVSAAAATTSGDLVTWQQVGGLGQTWQDMSGSRAIGTTYTNSTPAPIKISIKFNNPNTTSLSYLSVGANQVAWTQGPGAGTYPYTLYTEVPVGGTYSLTSATGAIGLWMEERA